MYYLSLIRCEKCKKISYLTQERAMYAALIMAVKYGKKFKAYRKYACQLKNSGYSIWHIATVKNSKTSTKARREQRKRRQTKYGLSRKEVGLSRRQVGL